MSRLLLATGLASARASTPLFISGYFPAFFPAQRTKGELLRRPRGRFFFFHVNIQTISSHPPCGPQRCTGFRFGIIIKSRGGLYMIHPMGFDGDDHGVAYRTGAPPDLSDSIVRFGHVYGSRPLQVCSTVHWRLIWISFLGPCACVGVRGAWGREMTRLP